jgi:hypothetical protein
LAHFLCLCISHSRALVSFTFSIACIDSTNAQKESTSLSMIKNCASRHNSLHTHLFSFCFGTFIMCDELFLFLFFCIYSLYISIVVSQGTTGCVECPHNRECQFLRSTTTVSICIYHYHAHTGMVLVLSIIPLSLKLAMCHTYV